MKLLHIEEWPGEKTKCGLVVADLNPDTDRHGSLMACINTPPKRFDHCERCFGKEQEANTNGAISLPHLSKHSRTI